MYLRPTILWSVFQWLIQLYSLLGQRPWGFGTTSKQKHNITVQCCYSLCWASSENAFNQLSACSGAAKACWFRSVQTDCYLYFSTVFLSRYWTHSLFFARDQSIHYFCFIWPQSRSHFLPLWPQFFHHEIPFIIQRLSFLLHPFPFTVCPLCDLSLSGRQRGGLQAAVEIWSMTSTGQTVSA